VVREGELLGVRNTRERKKDNLDLDAGFISRKERNPSLYR